MKTETNYVLTVTDPKKYTIIEIKSTDAFETEYGKYYIKMVVLKQL